MPNDMPVQIINKILMYTQNTPNSTHTHTHTPPLLAFFLCLHHYCYYFHNKLTQKRRAKDKKTAKK